MEQRMFKDCSDAGRHRAERLAHLRRDPPGRGQPVVLGFMRGGTLMEQAGRLR